MQKYAHACSFCVQALRCTKGVTAMARDWFGQKKTNNEIIGLDGYYDQPGGWKLWVRRIVGIVAVLALVFAFAWDWP